MIIQIGNTKSRLLIPESIKNPSKVFNRIRNYMKVRPQGYNYSPKFKAGHWDGYIRLMNAKGEFLTGLVPLLYKYIEKTLALHVKLIDKRENPVTFKNDYSPYIGEIEGKVWEGRDYQNELAKKAVFHFKGIPFYRGIFDAATNAGKTILVALIQRNLECNKKTLFLCKDRVIFKQAVKFFTDAFGFPVGQIRSIMQGVEGGTGAKFDINFSFTVAMAKTLYNRLEKSNTARSFAASVDVLFVDECDQAAAKQYSRLVSQIDAYARYFVSGTPLEGLDNANKLKLIGLSGLVLGTVTNSDLIAKDVSSNVLVTILLNNPEKPPYKTHYQESQKLSIIESPVKMKLIGDVVEKHLDKQTVVSFKFIRHGRLITDYLKNRFPNLSIVLVHGKSENRTEDLEAFKQGKIDVLIASKILERGANIPNIGVLINASGGKSLPSIKQLIGRILRRSEDGNQKYYYDFYDQFYHTAKHSRDRIRIYKKEGFRLEIAYKHNHYFKPV